MQNRAPTSNRRDFLKKSAAGIALGGLAGRLHAAETPAIVLSDEHRKALDRRRRIAVQYDAYNAVGKDWDRWLAYRFRWIDAPGVQIDSIWWDIEPFLKGYYPTPPGSIIYSWPDAKTDVIARLVDETRKRGLDVFWNHRISEVDLTPQAGESAAWNDGPHPLKQTHPDWVLKTWWRHGLWNLAVEGVRRYQTDLLRHLAETYPLDGFQLDFARHVPCLPPGRQWELRGHVTEFVRMVREMTLDVARRRGRPFLLAARVPRSPKGCRVDGFDVEVWARQNLIDLLSLGSRSIEVDVEGYRQIVGDHVKLQPCCDDHHAPSGYRCPPIEVFRGTFANWWQQGADSVMTFNWANAEPELCEEMGGEVSPLSQLEAYREVGDPTTLRGKNKTFVVERRGGYPWAEGYFNQNADSPLPKALAAGEPAKLDVRIADPVAAAASKPCKVLLRVVLFGASDDDRFEVSLNGAKLPQTVRDTEWKDPQIPAPGPEPDSGGPFSRYRVDPKQKLLRLEYAVEPTCCQVGRNRVEIRREGGSGSVSIEKLEIDVRYT